MSHFCVYVFHNDETSINDLLAPFDENLELDEPIIKYTREEAIKKCRKDIEDYKNGLYAEYLKNTEAYENKYKYNPQHINYLKNEFPKKLKWTDDECFEYMKEGYETDEDDNILTTYNPDSKWDWYEVGGRWSGIIPNDECLVKDIDADKIDVPYAFITAGGVWVERGQMGWWGISTGDMDKDVWDKKFREYIKGLNKNIIITQVDCHI